MRKNIRVVGAVLAATVCAALWVVPGAAVEINTGTVTYSDGDYQATGGYDNRGEVTASATDGGNRGMTVGGVGFTNSGTVDARASNSGNNASVGIYVTTGGFTNSGTVTASANASGSGSSAGIYVAAGGFTNSGTVNAMPGNRGNGIRVASGGFTNSGTVTASTSATGSTGILIDSGGFTNSGTVTASASVGMSTGIQILSGGFTNSGTVTASASVSASVGIDVRGGFSNFGTVNADAANNGWGIHINSGDFANNGLLALGPGTGPGVIFNNFGSMRFLSAAGSTLVLGWAAGNFINLVNHTLDIESGANLVSIPAAGLAVGGGSVTHANFIRNISGGYTGTGFTLPTEPVLSYTQTAPAGGNMSVTVTRLANASSFATGTGAAFLGGVESLVTGRSEAELNGALLPYALIRSYADNQSSAAGVAAAGSALAEQLTPQATASAVPLMTGAARLAGDLFHAKLRAADILGDGPEAVRTGLSAMRGSAYANVAPGCGPSWLVWAEPFYHQGDQDAAAGSGYSGLTEKLGGGSVGVAAKRGDWSFGLAGHYLYSDVDGGPRYGGNYRGGGVSLGAGRRFALGPLAPWIGLSAGWARYRLEQTRSDDILGPWWNHSYRSSPDTDLVTASLLASNAFVLGKTVLTPEAGADYAYSSMESYTESNPGGGIAYHVSPESMNSFRSVAGFRLEYRATKRFSLTGRGAYYHEFWDKDAVFASRDAGGLPFRLTTRGMDVGRDSGLVGAGVKFRFTDRADLGVGYEYHFARRYEGHRVSALLRVAF